MKVIIFGATGMVGQGALRECLLRGEVTQVLCVGRSSVGQAHPKLRELLHADFTDFSSVAADLRGYDSCFFCMGTSSLGMNEQDYTCITYDYTMAAARVIAVQNPWLAFLYVSGAHTDSSANGRVMWARVKGRTENALLALPFGASYMLRPSYIQPTHGMRSKTFWIRASYAVVSPMYGLLKAMFPSSMITNEQMARAMLRMAKERPAQRIFESKDIEEWGDVL